MTNESNKLALVDNVLNYIPNLTQQEKLQRIQYILKMEAVN